MFYLTAGNSVCDITSTANQHVEAAGTLSYTITADGTVTMGNDGVRIVQLIVINSHRFVMINDVSGVDPYLMIGQQ